MEETYKGFNIEIVQDEDPLNPREENDNMGHMVCFHPRYQLGDKHNMTPDSLKDLVKGEDIIKLPLYLLDHSGLQIKTGRYACDPQGWDTSLVGYIYLTHEEVIKEYGDASKESLEKATRVLEGEVKEYSQYLGGDIWGYTITNRHQDEKDSCWGFFGYEHCLEEAKQQVDYYAKLEAEIDNGINLVPEAYSL